MRSRLRVSSFLVLAVMVLTGAAAHAGVTAVHCAQSADEIISYLELAGYEGDVDVRVVKGLYQLPKSFGLYGHVGSFRFSGGWDKQCLQQTEGAHTTWITRVIGGDPIGATFENDNGDLDIDNLGFIAMEKGFVVYLGPLFMPYQARAKVRGCLFDRVGSVRIERPDGPDCDRHMWVYFRNNLVAESTDPTLATEITLCSEDDLEVVHNTFVSNPNRALGVYGTSRPVVDNNAFSLNERNFAWDFFPEPAFPSYCRNVGEDFTADEAIHGHVMSCTNLPDDPLQGSWGPGPGSPAVDFGMTPEEMNPAVFPSFDLTGRPRFLGARPDAGAVEFQPPCTP